MAFPRPTPDELAAQPERAPLEILRSAVEVTERALLAAYPELISGDPIDEDPEVTPRQCLAASILSSLQLLSLSVRHYQAHLDHLAEGRHVTPQGDNDLPF